MKRRKDNDDIDIDKDDENNLANVLEPILQFDELL
jgi:hypothetical protein